MYKLSQKSLDRLKGVHPDLVKVVKRAIELTKQDFMVLEGLRTLERQKYLLKKGATKTLRSRHITGHAVDLVPLVDGKISWDWKYYWPIVEAMRVAGAELGVSVEHGANWKSFPDAPHHQLSKKVYQ
jgi:hypothetical protein